MLQCKTNARHMCVQMGRESKFAQEYCVLSLAGAEFPCDFRIVTFIRLPLADDRRSFRPRLHSLDFYSCMQAARSQETCLLPRLS